MQILTNPLLSIDFNIQVLTNSLLSIAVIFQISQVPTWYRLKACQFSQIPYFV